MGAIELRHHRFVAAGAERVWSLVSDHEGMPGWAGVREVVRRRPGAPDPDGVGALRVLRAAGLAVEERVLAFEPPRRLVTELIGGAPLRAQSTTVALEPAAAGTRVEIRVRAEPWLPGSGPLIRAGLGRALARALDGLARALEA